MNSVDFVICSLIIIFAMAAALVILYRQNNEQSLMIGRLNDQVKRRDFIIEEMEELTIELHRAEE